MDDLQCCPICHGNNLSRNIWSMDEGEVDAVECNDCYCGAPLDTWQKERVKS